MMSRCGVGSVMRLLCIGGIAKGGIVCCGLKCGVCAGSAVTSSDPATRG